MKLLRKAPFYNIAAILVSAFLIFGAYAGNSSERVYSSSCADFNGNPTSCTGQVGCTYPGNAGDCSPLDESTCGSTSGCTVNFGDCSPYSDGGGDGSACTGYNASCSYDSGSGACTGTPFTSCSGNYDNGVCTGSYLNCSNFNNNQISCQAEVGCTYPGNTGACSAYNADEATCGSTSGCTQNFGDCTPYSDGGGDGSACTGYNASCSYDSGSGACTGTPFTSCSGNYDNGVCIEDHVAPTLSTATVNNTTLTLTYNEDLDSGSTPATSAFTVNVNGSPVTINSPAVVTGSTVVLTLAAGVGGGTVTISYTPGASPIQDVAGNDAGSLSGRSVTNSTDVTAPTLSTATVNSTTLTLTYNEALDTGSTPATSAFTVNVNGSPVTINSPAVVTGSTVVLTLAANVGSGTVTLNYSVPGSNPIQDVAGNDAGSLSGRGVTNNTDTTPPTLSTATVNNTTLTLTYNEDLDSGSTPATSAFTVNVNGSPVTKSSVHISGSTVIVMLLNTVNMNTTVTLDYTPGGSPIQDSAGNDAASLSNRSVTNNTSCGPMTVGSGPKYSSVVGNKVYVGNQGNSNVSVIDTTTNTVIANIPVGTTPDYSSVVGDKVYVNNKGSSNVSVIDTTTNTVIATIPVGASPLSSSVVGTRVYVGNGNSNVSVIDTTTNTVIATIPVGTTPNFSSVFGTRLYVGNQGSSNVSVIDTTTNTVIATIPLGAAPLPSSVVGTRVYVGNGSSNVSVVDTTTNTVIANIPVGASPQYSLVVGTRLYVNNYASSSVSVIDTTTNTVIATIPVGNSSPSSSVVGTKVYVNNYGASSVTVIDTTTNTVIGSFQVGVFPYYSYVVGSRLYVNNSAGGTVAAIDTVTDTVQGFCTPYLLSLTSGSSNTTYTSGQSVNLTANFNKNLGSGSKMRVTLNTGAVANLTTVSGSTLSGTYTVGSVDATPDLSVSSISTNSSYTLVSDTAGTPNTNSNYYVFTSPDLTGDTSRNLGDLKNITIGTEPLTIAVGTNPYQMVTVGSYTYVANQGSDNVTIFNNTTNTVVTSTNVGSQPYGMAYNSTSKEIYVANLKGNSVSVIDADPLSGTWKQVTNTITSNMGVEPYYVTSLGTKMYVTNNLSWTVSEINTATHAVTATINVGAHPRGIKALDSKLYVANFGSNYGGSAQGTVSIIDTENANAVTTVNVGSGPRGVAVNGTDVYVANFNDNTVSRINTASGNAVTTINVGTNPRGILALNNKIYVQNYQDGTISIIDGTSHAVTGTYSVGNTPAGMAAIGNDVAISRFTDGVVDIFDTTTLALKTPTAPDTTAPVISDNGSSSGVLTAGTTSGTLSLTTDESATCKYGTTANTAYASIANTFSTTNGTSHSQSITGLSDGSSYNYYVRCIDTYTNANSTDYTISFSVASASSNTAPDTGGQQTGGGGTVGNAIIIYNNPLVCLAGSLFNILTGAACSSTSNTTVTNPAVDSLKISLLGLALKNDGVPPNFRFTKDLSVNMINDDVRNLQRFLNLNGYPVATTGVGSLGKENRSFGPATLKALIRFQKDNKLVPPIGHFGPATRGVMNATLKKLGL